MLEVIRPGILTTVQDLGRSGYRHLGVAQCGALDEDALICGNRLLGNEPTAAGLEIVLGPIEIRFTQASWFALSGADFNAQLDGEPASCGWTHYARAGQVLRLSGAKLGMRAYLTVAGGIATEPVMGSRATDLKAGFGGLAGRALQAGDRLALGQPRQLGRKRGMGLRHWHPQIRVLPGPELAQCDEASQAAFWQQPWRVSPQSDRMGYRLQGPTLQLHHPLSLLSHGVLPGLIQLPPSGAPIILLADAQTTGGYPRIGCVIDADFWLLAQARPGSVLQCVPCTVAQAHAARRLRQAQAYRFAYALAMADRA